MRPGHGSKASERERNEKCEIPGEKCDKKDREVNTQLWLRKEFTAAANFNLAFFWVLLDKCPQHPENGDLP